MGMLEVAIQPAAQGWIEGRNYLLDGITFGGRPGEVGAVVPCRIEAALNISPEIPQRMALYCANEDHQLGDAVEISMVEATTISLCLIIPRETLGRG